MQELIRIEATPAQIVGNFDEVETQLQEYLKQYDVVVTADSVGDAKKLRTELRKQIGELDQRIKDALADASAPIREADERRKKLVQLGRDVDAKIKEQVDRFEDETRWRVKAMLTNLRGSLWTQYAVVEDYRRAELDDLVKLTAITKKGSLSAAVKKELESRVRDDKALQDRTHMRLSELKNRSYDAGLTAPLTRDHVRHFLFSDDDYAAELQRILDAEVERQQQTEQKMRAQQEREQQQKAEAEQREADRKARMESAKTPHTYPERQERFYPQDAENQEEVTGPGIGARAG